MLNFKNMLNVLIINHLDFGVELEIDPDLDMVSVPLSNNIFPKLTLELLDLSDGENVSTEQQSFVASVYLNGSSPVGPLFTTEKAAIAFFIAMASTKPSNVISICQDLNVDL